MGEITLVIQEHNKATGSLQALFKSERECLTALEVMRPNGATKKWEKFLTFKLTGKSMDQVKDSAKEIYRQLKPMDGFSEAEVDLSQTLTFDDAQV